MRSAKRAKTLKRGRRHNPGELPRTNWFSSCANGRATFHLRLVSANDTAPISPADVRHYIERSVEIRGGDVEDLAGFEKVINDFLENPPYALDIKAWSSRQVYIALGNFMTCAALLGVDTCPMEGLDPAGYDKALGLEGSGFWTVAACPAGYRAETDKHSALPKVRFEKQEIITYIP